MSWETQGRQDHGWFGHGTAPRHGGGADDMFRPENVDARIASVAYGSFPQMPRKDWHRHVLSLDQDRLRYLRTAMRSWMAARSLPDAAFQQRFLDPLTSDKATAALREAAEGALDAASHQDLKQASGELATAMQSIGLDRWHGFLRDAADRAQPYPASDSQLRLIRDEAPATPAANPTPAPDAAAPNPPPGGYVAANPRGSVGKPSVGSGQCVALVRQDTGAPSSLTWQKGVQVQGNLAIRPGTAIATFDANGHYVGHAAIYLGQDNNGIRVVDQWIDYDEKGKVSKITNPHERTLPFNDPNHTRINRGEFYYVVK